MKIANKPIMLHMTKTPLFTLLFFSPLFLSLVINGEFSKEFLKTNLPSEKMSHLHFYFHDIVSGDHPTAVTVAGTRNKFGATAVIDDPLTEGAERGSKVVGRAQGVYSMSSQDLVSLLMVLNYGFSEGKYNGSSLSILGRNRFLEGVRELPIVGGTGLFRFARGYALAKTERFNVATGDAVVEYNVFVMHH